MFNKIIELGISKREAEELIKVSKKGDYKIDLETKLDDLVETIYKTILFLMGSKIKNKEIKKK